MTTNNTKRIIIDLNIVYRSISGDRARIADLDRYIDKVEELAGFGNEIVLTGAAPVWLYLKTGHHLHGKARRLLYSSPGQGLECLPIFDHDPQ